MSRTSERITEKPKLDYKQLHEGTKFDIEEDSENIYVSDDANVKSETDYHALDNETSLAPPQWNDMKNDQKRKFTTDTKIEEKSSDSDEELEKLREKKHLLKTTLKLKLETQIKHMQKEIAECDDFADSDVYNKRGDATSAINKTLGGISLSSEGATGGYTHNTATETGARPKKPTLNHLRGMADLQEEVNEHLFTLGVPDFARQDTQHTTKKRHGRPNIDVSKHEIMSDNTDNFSRIEHTTSRQNIYAPNQHGHFSVDKDSHKYVTPGMNCNCKRCLLNESPVHCKHDCKCNECTILTNPKQIRSGITDRVTDKVIFKENYPQTNLRMNYASKNICYNDLDLPLFVAGFLESVKTEITQNHELAIIKLEHMISLMYLNKVYEWSKVRDFHAAVLREIELGNKQWTDSFLDIELRSLQHSPYIYKPNYVARSYTNRNTNNVSFCSKFNKGQCSLSGDHSITLKTGQTVWAQHICAMCWLSDKVIKRHAEHTQDCPHAKQQMQTATNQNINSNASNASSNM